MSTAGIVTRTSGSKLSSREISSLSSRLTTSFTRSKRCFIEIHHGDTEDTKLGRKEFQRQLGFYPLRLRDLRDLVVLIYLPFESPKFICTTSAKDNRTQTHHFSLSVISVSLRWNSGLKLLGDLFQSVALDDIANLVFIEISELAAALNPGPDLFHIVLEPAASGDSAVLNRLPLAQNPRSSGADDSAIGHITTRDRTL